MPVYALALPLFEPVHDGIRRAPAAIRALAYGTGIVAVEYAAGWTLRRVMGRAPWDYGQRRWSVRGLTRLDYLPLWALLGLAAERLHDHLTAR